MSKQQLKTTIKAPSSRSKLARLIQELYQGRRDVRLVCDPDGSPRMEKSGRTITAAEIAKWHLTHQQGLGVYLVRSDNTCSFAAVDFDNKPDRPDPAIKSKVRAVAKQLDAVGIDYLICTSQSGRGFHLTVYFAEPVPARVARRFLLGVCKLTGLAGPEVFPKQEQLPPDKVGNALRLPLFNKSLFVDPANLTKKIDPIEALEKVTKHTKHDLCIAAKTLGIDLSPSPPKPRQAVNAGTRGLSGYVQSLLSDEASMLAKRWRGDITDLKDGTHSSLVMSITCLLIKAYVPTEDVPRTMECWCAENDYKSDREDWLEMTIEKAYRWLQNDYRTKLAIRQQPNLWAPGFATGDA